jgi:hypothetical protein
LATKPSVEGINAVFQSFVIFPKHIWFFIDLIAAIDAFLNI